MSAFDAFLTAADLILQQALKRSKNLRAQAAIRDAQLQLDDASTYEKEKTPKKKL